MKITINRYEATEMSLAYSAATITDIPAMTSAELDLLTESLGVDILIF